MSDSIPIELTHAVATIWNLLPRWLKITSRRLAARRGAGKRAHGKESVHDVTRYARDSQALAAACELISDHAVAVGIDADALLRLVRHGDLGQLENALLVIRKLESSMESQATDDTADYLPASQLLDVRFPSLKAIRKALDKNPSIRWRRPLGKNGKPVVNRLEIHAGDWARFTELP